MPRKRALLTLRAVNSVKIVFGAKIAPSVTDSSPESAMVDAVTAVTLPGTSLILVASFSAVTMTVGSTRLGAADCANAAVGPRASTNNNVERFKTIPALCAGNFSARITVTEVVYYRNGNT